MQWDIKHNNNDFTVAYIPTQTTTADEIAPFLMDIINNKRFDDIRVTQEAIEMLKEYKQHVAYEKSKEVL